MMIEETAAAAEASLRSWHEECQSAWLYRVIADHEEERAVSDMFRALAEAAESQASLWARQRSTPPPPFRPDPRARLAAGLIRWLGPRAVKPMLASLKVRGLSALSNRGSGLTHAMPTEVGEVGARHRGVASGGNLRAAVFGVNDGLVSNTCLILGVAGAGGDAKTLLGTGVAGLMAGALSMAAGEYVSMRSQREVFESQIALERAELAQYPEEEIEELALIYQARGLELDAARRFARELVRTPEHALDTLAREELGLNPDELGSPWGAASASFGAFAGGALIPLMPWIFGAAASLQVSLGLAVTSLFAVGASLSLFTGRGALASGMRMVLIGAGAGAATWGIGQLFGVAAGAL
jgi:VIT1/CCC1 family predicted Fe2+/Mn2+ transporter